MYLDDDEFEHVRTFRKNVRNEKITFEEYDDSTLLQTIYWLEQNQMFFVAGCRYYQR